MSGRPAVGGRGSGASGSVSLMIVLLLPALMFAAGLVLDGGRQIAARREAHGQAAAAARAAVQLSPAEVYGDGLDPGRAVGRAHAELARVGAAGTVSVSGNVVAVGVSTSVDYLLLPGGGQLHQVATATPLDGITGGSP